MAPKIVSQQAKALKELNAKGVKIQRVVPLSRHEEYGTIIFGTGQFPQVRTDHGDLLEISWELLDDLLSGKVDTVKA